MKKLIPYLNTVPFRKAWIGIKSKINPRIPQRVMYVNMITYIHRDFHVLIDKDDEYFYYIDTDTYFNWNNYFRVVVI